MGFNSAFKGLMLFRHKSYKVCNVTNGA